MVGKTGLTEEFSGRAIGNGPVAVAKEGPVAGVAEQAGPDFLGSEGAAADEAGNLGVGP